MPSTFKPYNKRVIEKDSDGHLFDRTKAVFIPNEIERNGITYIITHNQVYSKINGMLKKVPALPPDLSEMELLKCR
jgi:hypothetical protein